MTSTPPDPRDELAATIARAEARIPAIADRLAPRVAPLRDPRVIRALVGAELDRLLGELATGVSEPARRGLLGVAPRLPATRSTRKAGRA